MTCGIYCITNLINGKQYVGQSVDIEKRMNEHIHSDSNSKIHQAIKKYGVKNFKFEPLIRCSPEELDEQEVKFIRLLNSYEKGYNQTRGGQHHVFNIEYNYETYSELKKTVQEKKDIISEIKRENNRLHERIKELNNRIVTLRKVEEKAENNNKDLLDYKTKLEEHVQKIIELKTENGMLSEENSFLERENKYLRNITNSSHEELAKEIELLKTAKKQVEKERRNFKKEICILNDFIDEKDSIILERDRQIQILYERLGWQPKKNIFNDLLQERKAEELEGK